MKASNPGTLRPINSCLVNKNLMERKVFIQQLGAAALLASMGVSLESCTNDAEDEPTPSSPGSPGSPNSSNALTVDLSLNDFSSLNTDDAWLLHPDRDILLVNISGTISAFSSSCPHSGCARDWEREADIFRCRCHGSEFNTDGSLAKGPATSGLTKLTVNREEDILTIG